MELRILWDSLLSFLFPPHCPKCGTYVDKTGGWCAACLQETLRVHRLALPGALAGTMEAAWALGEYHGALRNLIRGLKYQGRRGNIAYIHTFLQAAERSLKAFPKDITAVPVPLHPKKERARGFNQAELIFGDWLQEQGVPLQRLLCRARETAPMYGLSAAQRRSNLADAFALAEGVSVKGRNILLLDDIFTTGATIFSCTQVLRHFGANHIYALVLSSDHG